MIGKTNAEIGTIREVETFMVPDNPSVIQGVTRSISGGNAKINEASNAMSGTKFFNFSNSIGDTEGILTIDFTEYRPTKVALSAWFKINSGSNGGAFSIKHMNSDGSVVTDYSGSYAFQPNIQQYKNIIFDHPKIIYLGVLPYAGSIVSCDITNITVMK